MPVVALVSTVLLVGCALCAWLVVSLRGRLVSSTILQPEASFVVAYSPEKAALFTELVEGFNDQHLKTPDGQRMNIQAVEAEPEAMVAAALKGEYQAISPDSSIWLDQLDGAWQERTGSDVPLVGETIRYAVSPVVITMWEDVARSMGYPDRPIGWGDIMARARSDAAFRWSHPSTGSASGLLATLAEFYAGADKTRGLTIEDAQADATLEYVGSIEKTVRYYGEGELAIIDRALNEGPGFLDAFVVQEQLLIYYNRQKPRGPKLVAVYPAEGTLWEDHPLALLESADLTSEQRLTFASFRDYLLSRDSQMRVLSHGYRPADLSIPLDDPASPINSANGADPSQPQTTLQIPSPAVVEVVKEVWWYTKRHTNVVLVVDTSGSMKGEKLANAQEALRVFVEQIKSEEERVALIRFATSPSEVVPLDELGDNRDELSQAVEGLSARGNTALLDAVEEAYDQLQALGDRERINAIVAMTDGRENASRTNLRQLTGKMQQGNESGVPVVVFAIAYGGDADWGTLQALANATGGQVREGDLETIRQLYKILSTYF